MDVCEQGQRAAERDTDIAIRELLGQKTTYVSTGFCELCGEEIPYERVRAINAVTCIVCQKEEEMRVKRWR